MILSMQASNLSSNSISNFWAKTVKFPSNVPYVVPLLDRVANPRLRFSMSSTTGLKNVTVAAGRHASDSEQDGGFQTLMDFMGKRGANVSSDLVILISHLQYAAKRIAALVASPSNSELGKQKGVGGSPGSTPGRDAPKPLDLVSNEIILSALQNSGKVSVMASEEEAEPVWITDDGPFVVVTDPLDGSRNIDASIPTGTIFGIYKHLVELDHLPTKEKALLNSLQSGSRLIAAGYVLYSSATIFCISFGSGTHAFTLDHSTGDFVLTHPSIKIPSRGQIYSVNDARYFDWPEGLRQYIDTVRQGKGQFPKKVFCSLYMFTSCRLASNSCLWWDCNEPKRSSSSGV